MGAGQLLQQLEKKYAKSESIARSGKQLSEGQVYLLFDRVCSTNNQMLSEGKIWEADDPAAPKMSTWDKIKTKASEFGKNLTTKVTASKLNSAWKAAKQPTDSEELAAFLVKQGVNAEVVDKTFVDMKLPKPKSTQAAAEKSAVDAGQGSATRTPAATTPTPSTVPATTPTVEKPAVSTSAAGGDVDATPQPNAAGTGSTKNTNTLYSQVRADIKRLDKRSKQQLMSYLEKGLSA
jgi:predicted nucleic acid binding AN1-type Zn finger protein